MFRATLCFAVTALLLGSGSAVTVQEPLSPQEMRYLALETEIALSNNAQVGQYVFKAEVQQASIILTGEVPDNESRVIAERVARQVVRAYDVKLVNKIRVIVPEAEPAPPGKPTPVDEGIMKKLRQMIDEQFPELAANIDVSFDTQPMPTIVLEGLIPTYDQKLELSRFLRAAFRDLPVVNNLRVRRNYDGDKSFYVSGADGSRDSIHVVEPRRRARGNGSEKTEVTVRKGDAEIAKQLGEALRSDPIIKHCKIEVRVDDGVAWLAGRVETPGQKVRAIKLASVQPGVRYVVNQLEIRPPSDEPSAVTVRIPEPDDVIVYVQRYLETRVPELEQADVKVVENEIIVNAPGDNELTEAELREAEARLRRLPELKGFAVSVIPSGEIDRTVRPERPVQKNGKGDRAQPRSEQKQENQKSKEKTQNKRDSKEKKEESDPSDD